MTSSHELMSACRKVFEAQVKFVNSRTVEINQPREAYYWFRITSEDESGFLVRFRVMLKRGDGRILHIAKEFDFDFYEEHLTLSEGVAVPRMLTTTRKGNPITCLGLMGEAFFERTSTGLSSDGFLERTSDLRWLVGESLETFRFICKYQDAIIE
ncbi:MAG: hypothetical protein AAGA35_03300 [Patescibacteria group bacterium]